MIRDIDVILTDKKTGQVSYVKGQGCEFVKKHIPLAPLIEEEITCKSTTIETFKPAQKRSK